MTHDNESRVEQPWNIILVPYDGGSRLPGSGSGVASWAEILEGRKRDYVTFPRDLGAALPFCLEAEVKRSLHHNKLPLLIGGDHSLTFFSVKALTERYGALDIILFDAHHDSYRAINLSNYSVFYHLAEHYGACIKTIGCRYDLHCMPEPRPHLSRPTYVSVDVDFFDPNNVPSVSHPVPLAGGLDAWRLFKETLSTPPGQIVGADIVEWRGSAEAPEVSFVGQVFDRIYGLGQS